MTACILVVDDEPDLEALVLQKFRRQIRDGAMSFLFAHDGVEALAVLEGNCDVDLVVTDINMPRMDGYGFMQGVRADAQSRAIPILVLTTESSPEKKLRARDAGATGWIVKPFDPQKLVDAINRVAA